MSIKLPYMRAFGWGEIELIAVFEIVGVVKRTIVADDAIDTES